ncbi:hypothetical protein GCM10010174_05220 [Kutzneria viridogrisea]|uniref:DUF3618 domain-containing protein n=2 Tax=Kutzneria TaxID=43356 RepID=W5WAV9_9PSEU|nr:DUF3618 domain-containing protein [Kutzneria albida]AHH98067.1 hypothetical protein KALB_4705 [Kutzneria albida DSM 43870]MBA8924273.1 ElaB/YqjD/DUF883 family membrane-anchored ribosome-binding protein [Kutzneria viridogrisea]
MSTAPRNQSELDEATLRADIELTRSELGDTVEALAHKVNVPARVKEQVRPRVRHLVNTVQRRPGPSIAVAVTVLLALGLLLRRGRKG